MKTKNWVAWAVIGCALWSSSAAQEAFIFRNYRPDAGVDAPVFDAVGNRLAGTNYVAMLWGGPTPDALAPAREFDGVTIMQPIPFTYLAQGQPGYFAAGYVEVAGVCGDPAWLQVRAWDALLGSSYEEALGLGVGGYGASPLFQLHGSDVCLPNPPPPVPLVGLQSFSLVPEPGVGLLLLLGVATVGLLQKVRSWRSCSGRGSP
jgi:hypothetical protein